MADDILKWITVDPKIMFGKPVITGTRVPVDLVLEKLAFGNTIDTILESYPNISKEAVYACLYYATLQIRNEHIYSIAS